MHKARIHLLLGANTIILYGLVLFLLPRGDIEQWLVIGCAMALMMIAPSLIINRELDSLATQLRERDEELENANQELEALKHRFSQVTTQDELTGCANERHFMEMLTQHRALSERGTYQFTLAVLQVDQFSEIVEDQGLATGNEVLELFARVVKAALREVDIVGRIGTDKFALILSGASEDDAVNVMGRISQLVGQIRVTDAEEIHITSSGGLTSYHGTETAEEQVDYAPKALDFAVEQGR
ncbi:MAG: GGDEF domain-containing protein [Pseudomonadales bacterium]|nr:GGDEF domain-containing protein [Pseudomonadales bacterium]